MQFTGRAEYTDYRCPRGCGHMHKTGVIANRCAGMSKQIYGVLDAGFARQVDTLFRAGRFSNDVPGNGPVALSSQEPDLSPLRQEVIRHRRKVCLRPAFGRPEFRAGTKCDNGSGRDIPADSLKYPFHVFRVGSKAWVWVG